jgi:predicted nucleic acid-binding protein
VRLFLDSSVMIAAAASEAGASREVFRLASERDWRLMTTPYAVAETIRNIAGFPAVVTTTDCMSDVHHRRYGRTVVSPGYMR